MSSDIDFVRNFDMQSPGLYRVFDENAGLRSNERIDLRFSLNEYQNEITSDPTKFIKDRLSQLSFVPGQDIDSAIPNLAKIGSFLMKNETKYIGVLENVERNYSLCRICGKNSKCVLDIFKSEHNGRKLIEMISFC